MYTGMHFLSPGRSYQVFNFDSSAPTSQDECEQTVEAEIKRENVSKRGSSSINYSSPVSE